jgi:uncharacterized protein YbaR (Trm112 family)
MWQIEHQCPQCGAPVTVQETDHLLCCPFCRTRLYFLTGQHTYYCLPTACSDAADIRYIPYWRFKGMAFFCTESATVTKIIDTNNIAAHLGWLPYSLGVRPQALKLRFITPETKAVLCKPQVSVEDLYARIEQQITMKTFMPISHRAFIGEKVSIIFAPIIMRHGNAFDGVLNRFLASVTETASGDLSLFEQPENLHVQFIPCLCPSCGSDLGGEKESAVFLCGNCSSAWCLSDSGLKKIEYRVLSGNDVQEQYLPFWKIKVRIEGIELKSWADFMRLTNASRLIKREWEETEFYFWTPAFKISPKPFLRLAQGMTVIQPETADQDEMPPGSFYPVTLTAKEASEIILVTLAEIAIPKKDFFVKLPEVAVQAESFMLVYVPFDSCGSEFINSRMGMCINKNTLRFGMDL